MAAPSGTKWGAILGSGYGRIGVYISTSNSATKTTATAQLWFWSKYSVSDTNNELKFGFDSTSGYEYVGSVSINTTVDSGSGWSTSNQILLATISKTYTRGTTDTVDCTRAYLSNVDRVGSDVTMTSYSDNFTIPKLDSYTVSYNANGGSGAPSSQTKTHGVTLTLSSTKPTRTGYSFQGWATSSGGSVAYAVGASYTANASVTLYAVWKANTYTVSYNANGGTGAPGNQTKTYGVTLTLSSTKPTRTNYTFKGWGTAASATTVSYAAGASYTANAGITLYAVWELAYTKPRITNFSVTRCSSDGTTDDNGTYALVTFNWATDNAVTSITIGWTRAYNSDWTSITVSASGTSGSASQIVADGSLSTDYTYDLRVTVADSGGSFSRTTSVAGAKYIMDVFYKGDGIAFGKPAEYWKWMDVAYTTEFRDSVYFDSEVNLKNDKSIWGQTADGSRYLRMLGMSTNDNTILGYGGYSSCIGATNVYGNAINMYSQGDININAMSTVNVGVDFIKTRATLQLTKTTDASGTATTGPALMIGDQTGVHLEFDGNEIMAKGSGTTTGSLALNQDGGNVTIGKSGSSTVALRGSTVSINGCKMATNTVLWSGAYYMQASHTCTLSQSISSQANGIVLVWSYYSGGAQDYAYSTTFLPKYLVNVVPSDGGITVRLNTRTFNTFAVKYIYMTDTTIKGHDSNASSAWTSTAGVVVTPTAFVLRYVIGV